MIIKVVLLYKNFKDEAMGLLLVVFDSALLRQGYAGHCSASDS